MKQIYIQTFLEIMKQAKEELSEEEYNKLLKKNYAKFFEIINYESEESELY